MIPARCRLQNGHQTLVMVLMLAVMASPSFAFSISSLTPSAVTVSSNTRLFSSSSWPTPEQERQWERQRQQMQQEQREPTPAVVYGHPLDEGAKKRNKQLVVLIKEWVFDTLYPTNSPQQNKKKQHFAESGDAANSVVEQQTLLRSYIRFYALETIARVPYFSYLSVLHLWETLGMWRQAEYLKLHFAESWNELHHLLIMEELIAKNGRLGFRDQFVAQHVAWFYYWIVFGLYVWNPSAAYNLNQAVEEEAFETYDRFLKNHEETLKSQPAPRVAVQYYTGQDLYMFDAMRLSKEYQHAEVTPPETPLECETLYDTFSHIRNDEMEHAKTMAYLQQDHGDQAVSSVASSFFFGTLQNTNLTAVN